MTKDKDLNCPSEKILESRRKMLRNFGLGGAAIAAIREPERCFNCHLPAEPSRPAACPDPDVTGLK